MGESGRRGAEERGEGNNSAGGRRFLLAPLSRPNGDGTHRSQDPIGAVNLLASAVDAQPILHRTDASLDPVGCEGPGPGLQRLPLLGAAARGPALPFWGRGTRCPVPLVPRPPRPGCENELSGPRRMPTETSSPPATGLTRKKPLRRSRPLAPIGTQHPVLPSGHRWRQCCQSHEEIARWSIGHDLTLCQQT